MKVTVDNKPKDIHGFPCLMMLKKEKEVNSRELIVLFYRNECGIVLFNKAHDDIQFRVGADYDDWCLSDFDIFDGKITLSNE